MRTSSLYKLFNEYPLLSFTLVALTCATFVLLIICIVLWLKRRWYKRLDSRRSSEDGEKCFGAFMIFYTAGDLYDYMSYAKDGASRKLIDASSGRGAMPLIPKTIARELIIKEQIGQGRYGKVYKALRGDDFVAVKVF